MANQGNRAYYEQIPNQLRISQFANVNQLQINRQEANQVNHNRINVPVAIVPAAVPLVMMPRLMNAAQVPHPMPLNQAQRRQHQAQRIQLVTLNQRNNNPRQLIPCCKSFEGKLVVELLKSNDPDDRDQLSSIVADIARSKKQDLCTLLFTNGYQVDVLNEKNQTMLHIAFHNNSHSIITTIMDSLSFNKNSIDYADSSGLTHLHIACAYGNAGLAERYLKIGSDVNAVYRYDITGESSDFTPLHFAVSRKKSQIVKLLLQYGADVSLMSLKGQTPLHLACCYDKTGSDNLKIMEALIADSNVNINARDNQGNTPLLSLFCDKHHVNPYKHVFKIEEIEPRFDILIQAGADVTISNKECDTVLHLLIKNLKCGHNPISFGSMSFNDAYFVTLIKKILVSNSLIVNLKNKLGKTPLQLAVSFMSLDVVRLLLDYNASLEDLKIDHFYYPNVIPILEPVLNLISIVDLLSERGYTLSTEDNICILTFLIHESCNCKCLTYDSESRMNIGMILNFGSSRHIIDTLHKRHQHVGVAINHNVAYALHCYLDLANTGKFYVDAEVKRFLQVQFGPYLKQKSYENDKRTELMQLKSAVLKNEIKLYDMMLKNPHDISRLIKNSDFNPTFADTFPLFKDIVKGHITKALIRSYVESSTYEALKHKLFSSLPDLCCVMIIRLLSNLDILHMYAAAHPSTISR